METKEETKTTLKQYLAKQGLSSPISGFMLDKTRLPHGNTLNQQKRLEQEALLNAREYSQKRNAAIDEYREKIKSGEIIEKTAMEQRMETAHGHPDNESVQAARRRLAKMGIDWKTGNKLPQKKFRGR